MYDITLSEIRLEFVIGTFDVLIDDSAPLRAIISLGDPVIHTEIRANMSNHFNCFVWDAITHPCSNLNGGLNNPLFEAEPWLGSCVR